MSTIQVGDIVCGYDWSLTNKDKALLKITSGGIANHNYPSDSHVWLPRVYKVVGREGDMLRCQIAFLDGCADNKGYILSWRNEGGYEYEYDIYVKDVCPIGFFNRKCVKGLCKYFGFVIDAKYDVYSDDVYVNEFITVYNTFYHECVERTCLEREKGELEMKEMENGVYFEKLKSEVVSMVGKVKFSRKNQLYLEIALASLEDVMRGGMHTG